MVWIEEVYTPHTGAVVSIFLVRLYKHNSGFKDLATKKNAKINSRISKQYTNEKEWEEDIACTTTES